MPCRIYSLCTIPFFLLLAVVLPPLASATPTVGSRWNKGDSDTSVLNFELALEQLESTFYNQALQTLDKDAFHRAGFPDFARDRFRQIQQHKREHVEFFSEAIRESGADLVTPCKYRFPLDDPITFARASSDISTIVGAAYTGALGRLSNREYRVVNGMIPGVESRQAGWVNSALFHKNPWNTAFDSALTLRQAWTALCRFVESCPRKNEELVPPKAISAFPPLEVVSNLVPGQHGQIRFRGMEDSERRDLFVVFKAGINEVRTKPRNDGSFIVPPELARTGTNFIFVTSNDKPVNDDTIVAGPAINHFDFSSHDNHD